jgi:hypothetical protein
VEQRTWKTVKKVYLGIYASVNAWDKFGLMILILIFDNFEIYIYGEREKKA